MEWRMPRYKRLYLLIVAAGLTLLVYKTNIEFLIEGEYVSESLQSDCRAIAKQHELTITTLTKNSASYITEWIEYHLLVGVDHFYILDNESTDNLFHTLKPYIVKGIVTYVPWKDYFYRDVKFQNNLKTQQKGLAYAIGLYGCQSHWTALIDDDEFIVPKNGRSIKGVLKDYSDYGGLALGWAWFGSNGHISRPEGLVIESYTRRKAKLDILYKTIIQPKYFKRIKTVHYPVFYQNYSLVTEKFEKLSLLPEHIKRLAYSWNHPTSDTIQVTL